MAVDTQKFLDLSPTKTGGDVASNIKPKTSSERHGIGGSFLSIKVKIVKAADILKGTLAAKKIEEKKKQKRDQLLKRKQKEEELEKPPGDTDKNAKKLKLELPAVSWLDTVKNFVFNVLFGWAALKFLEFLPQMVGLLKPLASIAGFFIKFGEFILKTFITFVDWGYKAYDWTRGALKNLFGEEGAAAFDKFSGVLKTLINLQLTLTLAMIALANDFGSNIFEFTGALRHIFKYGLRRAGRRALIQILGPKAAKTVLGTGTAKALTATTAGGVTGGTATAATTGTTATTATTATGIGAAGTAGIILGALGIASAVGEGGAQILKVTNRWEENAKIAAAKSNKLRFYNPMKWWNKGVAAFFGILNRIGGATFGLFDIVGAPFRLIIEAIRWPFMNESQREKAGLNLEKFDARIREQFRGFFNMFDFLNIVPNSPGSWGSIGWWGDPAKAKESLGYDTNKPLTKEQRLELEVIEMNKVDTESLNKKASYEETNGSTIVLNSTQGSGNNNQSTESTGSFTLASSNGSGDSTQADLFYKNSG